MSEQLTFSTSEPMPERIQSEAPAELTLMEWQSERWAAFSSSLGEMAFSSIALPGDVWTREREDEVTIHAEARSAFSDLIEVAADRSRNEPNGRILLLPGDAGAGKTHLMGAFRREVERRHAGYFAYAQMSTELPLRRYLLCSIVECLEKQPPRGGVSAWLRLSNALVERASIPAEEREALRQEESYAEPLAAIRARLIDDLARVGQRDLHADFLTALLALQRQDGNANSAAMKYFRGDPLSEEDQRWLCSSHRLAGTDEPETLLKMLLRAVRAFGGEHGGAFVLCIDQIEDLYERGAPHQQRFPEMVRIVRSLAERNPGVVVVMACLQDYYTAMRHSLNPSETDRLELNPPPVRLRTECNEEEVAALVRRRLAVLDADAGTPPAPDEADELYPFAWEQLSRLVGSRPRTVLHACHQAWKHSRQTGKLPVVEVVPVEESVSTGTNTTAGGESQSTKAQPRINWPHAWNDFRMGWREPLPESESELAEMLAQGVNALAAQVRVAANARAAADLVHLQLGERKALAGICNAAAQGGRLGRQIESLHKTATSAARCPVAVRSTEFAKSAKSAVMQTVGKLVKAGGWRVVLPEAEWRALQAWQAFARVHGEEAGFAAWAREERPLAEVIGLCKLVQLEELPVLPVAMEGQGSVVAPAEGVNGSNGHHPTSGGQPEGGAEEDTTGGSAEEARDPARILLGETQGLKREAVHFEKDWLTTHCAVLGSPGSGKTTAAMVILEGLLMRGVPVILVDRKGDLSRYGHLPSLQTMAGTEGQYFRERVETVLYTPGSNAGRPLALNVLPARVPGASSDDVLLQAESATAALAAMMGYKERRADEQKRVGLLAAIQVLLELDDQSPTLARLSELITSEDPALLASLDGVPPKALKELQADLATFRRSQVRLLAAGAEPLKAERLLGLGSHAAAGGKTRLTVISTKGLNSDSEIQFWVAQLIMEIGKFASASPSATLQAAVMLDEADLYLPAVGKPASKQPLESALRRFRSGGVGLVLASQNPGDFDYRSRENIQTWLVGKVTQERSREKLRPVFGDAGARLLEKLAQCGPGEFCLVRGDLVMPIQAKRNLLKTEQMSDAEILAAARAGVPISQ